MNWTANTWTNPCWERENVHKLRDRKRNDFNWKAKQIKNKTQKNKSKQKA